jgi:hypothetical protein
MPSPPAGPLAVDLDVLKLGTTEDPVSLDDVERALYALTGWQKPQHLVDAALDVVNAYARQVRAGRVLPGRVGHDSGVCTREHLADHVCPVTVKTVEVRVPVPTPAVERKPEPEPVALPATDGNAPCAAGGGCVVLEGCPHGCQVAKFEAAERARQSVAAIATELKPAVAEPAPRVSTREPALTVEELLTLDESQLRPAQRAARAVLLAGEQKCAECGVTKPLDSFYRDNAKLTRRMGKCSDCANAAAVARRKRKTPQ